MTQDEILGLLCSSTTAGPPSIAGAYFAYHSIFFQGNPAAGGLISLFAHKSHSFFGKPVRPIREFVAPQKSAQDFILGNSLSSLRDLLLLPGPTQDCVLGYCLPSLRDLLLLPGPTQDCVLGYCLAVPTGLVLCLEIRCCEDLRRTPIGEHGADTAGRSKRPCGVGNRRGTPVQASGPCGELRDFSNSSMEIQARRVMRNSSLRLKRRMRGPQVPVPRQIIAVICCIR
jgi:hypothetical protein